VHPDVLDAELGALAHRRFGALGRRRDYDRLDAARNRAQILIGEPRVRLGRDVRRARPVGVGRNSLCLLGTLPSGLLACSQDCRATSRVTDRDSGLAGASAPARFEGGVVKRHVLILLAMMTALLASSPGGVRGDDDRALGAVHDPGGHDDRSGHDPQQASARREAAV
jgi:Stress up-regulated Nod 19